MVHTFSPGSLSGVFADFLSIPLFLSMFNDSVSPLPMQYTWTKKMANKDPSTKIVTSEIMTFTFDYKTILLNEQGSCSMQVKPDDGTVVELP